MLLKVYVTLINLSAEKEPAQTAKTAMSVCVSQDSPTMDTNK